MAKEKIIIPGGIDEYIEKHPKEVQAKLKEIREIIESVSGGAIQTVSYFQIPGYSYPGFDYSGMFAWFSFKEPYIRLHVRPPVLKNLEQELKSFVKTEAILSIPMNDKLPVELIKSLVKDSIRIMREKAGK